MNDEIKVNDYVRTKDGYIAKVTRLENANMIFCDNTVRECWVGEVKHILTENIIKHSLNIIDLVQKKDYANGHLVLEVHENYVIIENSTASCYDGEERIDVENIKTIVTKEQMEQMMYKVGE